MSLYIGKNHEASAPVQSIFRLAGSDEDALTYALGYLMANDREFCGKLIRQLKILPRLRLSKDYSIHLQEVTRRGFGRRDIVFQDEARSSGKVIAEPTRTRIVIEAKVGLAQPEEDQLTLYATEEPLWKWYDNRVVVALTQPKLNENTSRSVKIKLAERGIGFKSVQWHQVIDLALSHWPCNDSEVPHFLFQQFIGFIRRDYDMNYYDAEVHIQDIDERNEGIFEKGLMYVTSPGDKKAPLYFAPYFTRTRSKDKPRINQEGISKISRVLHTEVVDLNSLICGRHSVSTELPLFKEHGHKWVEGLQLICERARDSAVEEKWAKSQRLYYYGEPIKFAASPITKKSYNAKKPEKQIPDQIPKGFSLRLDQLVLPQPVVVRQ